MACQVVNFPLGSSVVNLTNQLLSIIDEETTTVDVLKDLLRLEQLCAQHPKLRSLEIDLTLDIYWNKGRMIDTVYQLERLRETATCLFQGGLSPT